MIKYKVVEAVRSEVLFDSECDHCAVKFASEHYHIHRRKLVVEGYEGGILVSIVLITDDRTQCLN